MGLFAGLLRSTKWKDQLVTWLEAELSHVLGD